MVAPLGGASDPIPSAFIRAAKRPHRVWALNLPHSSSSSFAKCVRLTQHPACRDWWDATTYVQPKKSHSISRTGSSAARSDKPTVGSTTGAIEPRVPYPPAMVFPSGFIRPCLPTKVAGPPSGPLWVHEIKQDGYRLMLRRDGARVRCFTRNGCDCTDHFPAIVDAALRIRATSFMIDGEAVIARADGSSDFMRCAADDVAKRRCCSRSTC